ncbi:hypothetical protein tinsulaeT_33090 [Thalassotalea insulae]|uniref:Uncharacterized protein n=2 Tax=Thalassotalea insulae TaxID=2056778 RepID=A0ABQ6GXE6_9GAMM|nr:hypothetical protein tinsulaeT_33090 [Thalassotalea insulae]
MFANIDEHLLREQRKGPNTSICIFDVFTGDITMKLFKALSTITLALLATYANAKTNDVKTTDLAQLEPVNKAELMLSVELHLADSIKQMNSALTTQAAKKLVLAQNDKAAVKKPFEAKIALLAE